MQPTTLNKALWCNTPVSVYDTLQKKLVLIVSSKSQCARYLNISNYDLNRAIVKKKVLEQTVFNTPLAIRVSPKEHREIVMGNTFVVLDNRFINDDFDKKDFVRDFSLEDVLKVGDIVSVTTGAFIGNVSKITDIADGIRGGYNTKKFGIIINGEKTYLLSCHLELH